MSNSGFDLFFTKKTEKETELCRALFKNSFDAIFLIDTKTDMILHANRAASKLMAKPINKIVGTPQSELYAKNKKTKSKKIFADRRKRGEYIREKRSILQSNGTKTPMAVTSQLINLKGKKLLYKVFHDISEHKKTLDALKESKNRYKTIIEYSNDMIWTLDKKGRFCFFNGRAEQITGYRLNKWIGKTFAPIIAKEDLTKVGAIFKKILSGQTLQYEVKITHKRGNTIILFVNTAPLYTKNKITGTVSFGRDITAQKYAEEELKKHRDHLEDLVKERSGELQKIAKKMNEANKKLKLSNKNLESFTYTVTHDLKEPLRAIEAFSKILLGDYKDKLDVAGKDYLKRISRASFRMNNLIDDLLSLSRISHMKNPSSLVSCDKLIKETIQQIKPLIEEKKAKIKISDKLPQIFCSRVKMKEVFYNLIVNAVKYNDKENPVIEIGLKDNVFFVKDNGLGIKKEHFNEIFRIFKRLHKSSEYGGGTGVGLSIVKKVIDEHHGRIWLESEEKKGTTFFFTISPKTEV